jgi:hypothetical protein
MEIPPQLLLLLPLSVAAGVDLYLTLLAVVVGVSTGAAGGAELPPLVSLSVLLGLAGLYLAELMAELRPFSALLWHNLQLVLRPLGAVLLGLFLLRGEATVFVFLGAAMAGVVAAFTHVLFWGKNLVLRIAPHPGRSLFLLNLAGDLVVVALVGLAIFRPEPGALVAVLLLLVGLLFGGNLHGVVRFGLALLADRLWGIVSPSRWKTEGELPRWTLQEAAQAAPGTPLGARAVTWGVVGTGVFKSGWILQRNRDLLFLYRRGRGARMVPIAGVQTEVVAGPLAKTVRYRTSEGAPSALFLQMGLNAPESHKW